MAWELGRLIALSAVLAAFPCAAQEAATNEVLGISLGAPITMKKCTGHRYSAGQRPCWEDGNSDSPGAQSVSFILADLPLGFDPESVQGQIVDGRLEVLEIATKGHSAQGLVLQALVEKYGEPHGHYTETLQNNMGVSFDRLVADWAFDNLDVTMRGFGSRVDRGSVTVTTKVGTALKAAQLREFIDSRQKL